MDRRVKERLVGASILVVLVVLFVPELLSGPKRAVMPQSPPGSAEPMRSVTIDLATSKATAATDPAGATAGAAGATDATGAADAREPAVSVSAANPPTEPAAPGAGSGGSAPTPPAADALDNAAASPKSAAAAAQMEPAHRGWVAQLGSFAARENAEKLERQLRSQGFSPVVSAAGAGQAQRFRVRIGPVADRSAAERLVLKLGRAGHPATLIAP